MLTPENHMRIIEISDAASRALHAGNKGLAEKLTAEAEKLLRGDSQGFDSFVTERGYNTERFNGGYVSKMTTELYDCWLAAGGEPT